MTAFLFWNMQGNALQTSVMNLALLHNIDVIMLAECNVSPATMLLELNQRAPRYFFAPSIGCEKIAIFTAFSDHLIPPVFETNRLTIRHVQLPGATDFLLSVVHMPSKVNWSDDSQMAECFELSQVIRDVEKRIGHMRTVLVGDLNMNPFDPGVVTANGLHGVMTRRVAERRTRTIQSKEFPFFYNPMWGLFGDETPGPPGTHYYANSEHVVYFWNMYDQVLIRPDLLSVFTPSSVQIAHSDGINTFATATGLPNKRVISDHFPIIFRLAV